VPGVPDTKYFLDGGSVVRILERGLLWWTRNWARKWTRKRPGPDKDRHSRSGPETDETREFSWRLATLLVILASAIMIPVAVLVLRPAPGRAQGGKAVAEQLWQGDEEVSNPAARVREKRSTQETSILARENEAPVPDPREFFSSLIMNVCGQTAEAPPGVKIDPASLLKIRETLLGAFPNAPDEVEVLYMSDVGSSGLFTLKVTDDQGREGIIGVRLIRLKRKDTPWEVESFMVIEPPK
jgi:hypothetical protein